MDTTTVRQSLEETYRSNRALIAGLAAADLDRRTPNPKWSVRQVAAHIAEDDGAILYVGKQLAKGKNAKAPGVVVNLMNWWTLRKHRRATAPDLLAVLDARHRALLAWLDELPPEAGQRDGEVSGMGRLSLADFLARSGAHSREHAAEIGAALS